MELNLKNDIVFKAFFSRKGNEKYLKEFLEVLLKIKIKEIIITEEVSLEKLFAEEKGGRLDLLAILNHNITVNIEMQVRRQLDFIERTMIYGSKLIAQEVGSGLNYNKMNKIIVINILDFKLFEFEEYISSTKIVLEKHRDCEIIENPKWYFIELPKFRKTKPDMENKLHQWLLLIDDYNKEGIEMAESKNKTLKDVRKMLEYLTGGDELNRLREKWAFDRARDAMIEQRKGERKGEKKGKKKYQLEIVKKLLAMGKDIEEIKIITNLSEEEIKKLKKS